MAGLADVVRLVLRYGSGAPEIVSATLIRAVAPVADDVESGRVSGAWVSVFDPAGREVFRRALPDPRTAAEVFAKDGAIGRAGEGEPRIVLAELSWPGKGSSIAVSIAGGSSIDMEAPPVRLPLEPRRPVVLEGPAAPAVVHPIWGAQNPRAFTLLFLPDGFVAAEMPVFHAAIANCIALFERTEPFASQRPALRVVHADIASDISGIAGTTPRKTAFRGHFQANMDRVILVDQGRALAALDTYVPGGSGVAMVVANSAEYGGSGGAALSFSCEASAAEIALHELGHSAFGLADEYDSAGQSATDAPIEPNVSGTADRAQLKWASLVAPATPLPTLRAGDPIPTVPPAGVGAFEGAKYHRSGRFRPEYDCKMRTLGQPFCAICRQRIAAVLARHLPG
ncbi:MAG: hypothetical protein JSS55_13130 [Proteobacteria bacterium]|nr:hypothetical protein [Pseudomonadota bacterium]